MEEQILTKQVNRFLAKSSSARPNEGHSLSELLLDRDHLRYKIHFYTSKKCLILRYKSENITHGVGMNLKLVDYPSHGYQRLAGSGRNGGHEKNRRSERDEVLFEVGRMIWICLNRENGSSQYSGTFIFQDFFSVTSTTTCSSSAKVLVRLPNLESALKAK